MIKHHPVTAGCHSHLENLLKHNFKTIFPTSLNLRKIKELIIEVRNIYYTNVEFPVLTLSIINPMNSKIKHKSFYLVHRVGNNYRKRRLDK